MAPISERWGHLYSVLPPFTTFGGEHLLQG